jgi:hypothetical protein
VKEARLMGSVNNVSVGLSQAQIDAIANVLFPEVPSGAVDGVNTVFTTTYSYRTERTYLYLNGQQMKLNEDYTESADKEVTFTFPPAPSDVVFIQYVRESLD